MSETVTSSARCERLCTTTHHAWPLPSLTHALLSSHVLFPSGRYSEWHHEVWQHSSSVLAFMLHQHKKAILVSFTGHQVQPDRRFRGPTACVMPPQKKNSRCNVDRKVASPTIPVCYLSGRPLRGTHVQIIWST